MDATPARLTRVRRKRWTVGVVVALATLTGAAALAPIVGNASSHREAPLISNDPQADNTDVYAFASPDAPSKVTLISNWVPFEEPAGGPNFYPFSESARYDIKVDNDADGVADVVYRWNFKDHYRDPGTFLYNTGPVTSLDDENLNFFQTYDLWRIGPRGSKNLVNNGIAAPSHVGRASMPNYAQLRDEAIERFGKSKTFAGQADDPFFLDLRIFDLLYGGDFSETGDDTLAGFNVNTIALQVPKAELAKGGNVGRNPVIGVWSSTSRRKTTVLQGDGTPARRGDLKQVSRLGMPLVNEVIIPVGRKDEWNASKPRNDRQFRRYYNDPIVPKVVNAVYDLDIPDSNPDAEGVQRADLIQVFLTGIPDLTRRAGDVTPSDELRLNMSIAPCERGDCADYSALGVIGGDIAGFPNGRRLADDVVDVALQVMEGELLGMPNDLSDGVSANDVGFQNSFPYVALPHAGSEADPH
jgi:hypothetical protein